MNPVMEFIKRRFKADCNWLNGNCYYFAIILKERFAEGVIYYDVVNGHFIFKYQDEFFDWSGKIFPDVEKIIEWESFDEYDSLQKKIIIRDCIC